MQNQHGHFTCVLTLILSMPLAALAEVPDPSAAAKLLPNAEKVGPPPVAKPGTRLVYFGGSATIPGVRAKLVPDENGNWVNKTTGQKYAESDVRGSGGVGYSVVRIGHIDKEVAQLTSSSYLLNPLDNTVSATGTVGLVSNAGAAGDYWIHPDLLKEVKDLRQNGIFVGRMPYVVMNRKYNAIRFQTDTESGHTTYVFDLDSGLMIFHGSSVIGGGVVTPGVNGQAGAGAGNTYLTHGFLVEVKQIDVPWQGKPVPEWAAKFNQLQYNGGTTTTIQNAGQFTNGFGVTLSVKARGDG
ncbi:MAG: hypothetical protein WD768_08850 [Phycisphaeraceae bacterium]